MQYNKSFYNQPIFKAIRNLTYCTNYNKQINKRSKKILRESEHGAKEFYFLNNLLLFLMVHVNAA